MPGGRPSGSPPSASLDNLNNDVFRLITDWLPQGGGGSSPLRNLASSSRTLRDFCLPVLFARCQKDVRRVDMGDPPEAACIYARHLTHVGPLGREKEVEDFEYLLDRLLSLQSVVLKDTCGQIPWDIWKSCVSRPRITSLSYDAGQHDLHIPPFPLDEVEAIPILLQTFSYTTTMWREWCNATTSARDMTIVLTGPPSMRPVFAFEQECLSAIVLRMHNTAVSLTLPLESTPILAMTRLSWPRLKELNLHGRLLDTNQLTHIRTLLLSLPSLTRLSILAARSFMVGMSPPIPGTASLLPQGNQLYTTPLPIVPPSSTARTPELHLSQLRVLEIASPDPSDGLFSVPMPMLTRLALRDYPRRYHQHVVALGLRSIGDGNGMNQPWHSALPTDRGLLSILTRMELPLLTSLEIAYMAEARRHSSEHALLAHVVDAFPRLQHLEIHRYRTQRRELTRFTPIAKILSRARSLQTVRLGLDCYNDPGAYCRLSGHRYRWLETLRTKVGPKILAIMQDRCPSLEHVAILYHGSPSSVWIEFHPPRCGAEEEPRVVVSYDEQYVESEMITRMGGQDVVF